MADTADQRPNLLTIPPEIRENIYRIIFEPSINKVAFEDEYFDYDFKDALVLFRINRQIYLESRKIFRDMNTFVRIETPWSEAQNHVAETGHVPIVITKDKGDTFQDHSLTVSIDSPDFEGYSDTQRFVILAEDLEKFTRMWFYSDLSTPLLNNHLQLELILRDPYTPEWEEKHMPRWLQRKLLLPFGEIRGLLEMKISGDVKHFASIETEVRELQKQPYTSPETCLREATRLKLEGNAELAKGNYHEALRIYVQAWEAMHIIIKGRTRHIHGEAFFNRRLAEEPYKGKNGQAERLNLRVQLVANTCMVYLKMEDYDSCRYWGLRTIDMLRLYMRPQEHGRDPTPEEEAVLGWPGADQMGKIYYRTAVACKHLDDMSEARRLLRVAKIYLPNDQSVQKEIAATALQLG